MVVRQPDYETPEAAVAGYIHWSSFIYAAQNGFDKKRFYNTAGWEMFMCPDIPNGGLAPTNTYPGNHDAGQVNDNGNDVVDFQAPRCAYTVNEALCPRNKFVKGFQGALTTYHYVNAGRVKRPAQTILATEWNADWHIVTDQGRGTDGLVCKSHRPVHGFVGIDGTLDMEKSGDGMGLGRIGIRHVTPSDLAPDPQPGSGSNTRLDWVGRNHGHLKKTLDGAGFNVGLSNFLYVDGHVETKSILDTVQPNNFEWGEQFYTIQ